MAKIDFNTILLDLDGEPFPDDFKRDEAGNLILKNNKPIPTAPARLGKMVRQVLLAEQKDEKLDAAKKDKCFELAVMVTTAMKSNVPFDLDPEDLSVIRERCQHLPILLRGVMLQLLR